MRTEIDMALKDLALRHKGPTRLKSIKVKLWSAIDFHVPVGYQNETGFHFGEPTLRVPSPEIRNEVPGDG